MKEYRKMTGKISWLVNSTRQDLSYTALNKSKKNNSAKISDFRDINRILKKVRERDSKIIFKKIGDREDLMMVGIGDPSFKYEEKAVGGDFLFMMTKAYLLEI